MDIKKFEKLYHRLFEIAWNSDYIDNLQDENNLIAVKIAVELYNQYDLNPHYSSRDAGQIALFFNTPISSPRARKGYYCSSNKRYFRI